MSAWPDYGSQYTLDDLDFLGIRPGKHLFISFRCPLFGFYFGGKPITLDDPQFFWQEHPLIDAYRRDGWEFVEPSIRFTFLQTS